MKLAVVCLPFPNDKTWDSQFSLQLVAALSQVGHDVSVLTRAEPSVVASVDLPRVQVFKVFQKKVLGDCQRAIETMMRLKPQKLLLVVDKKLDLKWSGIFLSLFATAQAFGCEVYLVAHNDVIQSKIDELRLSPLLVQAKKVFSAYPSKNYPWVEMNTSLVGLQSLRKQESATAHESRGQVFVFGRLEKRPQALKQTVQKIAAIEGLEKIHLAISPDAESLFKHLVIEEFKRAQLHSKVEFLPNIDFETCDKILAQCESLFLLDDPMHERRSPWIVGMALSRGLHVDQSDSHCMTVDEATNSILREILV